MSSSIEGRRSNDLASAGIAVRHSDTSILAVPAWSLVGLGGLISLRLVSARVAGSFEPPAVRQAS